MAVFSARLEICVVAVTRQFVVIVPGHVDSTAVQVETELRLGAESGISSAAISVAETSYVFRT